MDRQTLDYVRRRAGERCEYCGLSQAQFPSLRFHTEHIRARQHQGSDAPDNLCLACPFCNLQKGTNQSAYDPTSGQLVRLFNPRTDIWQEHFRSEQGLITGLTPEGRSTVALLQMNRTQLIRLRQTVVNAET